MKSIVARSIASTDCPNALLPAFGDNNQLCGVYEVVVVEGNDGRTVTVFRPPPSDATFKSNAEQLIAQLVNVRAFALLQSTLAHSGLQGTMQEAIINVDETIGGVCKARENAAVRYFQWLEHNGSTM